MSTTKRRIMESRIELMRDEKRILIFYPLIGKAEVKNIDELVSLFTLRCRLVSEEDFDMGLTLFGVE